MTQTAIRTVSYEIWQREHDLRIKAEQDRDHWKREFYLQREIRRAPVLQPITKAVLEECRHVERWGTVKAPDGSTRANYTTIAKNLRTSPDTVARHAERLEKLKLIEIHEHQGPKDERDRKYIHVKEEQLSSIDQLTDPEKVIPPQGGDRYRCQNPDCLSRHVKIKRKTTLVCLDCHHESTISETEQILNAQKQDAFKKSRHAQEHPQEEEDEKQLAEHCVYTQSVDCAPEASDLQKQVAPEVEPESQKQVAFADPPTFLRLKAIWVCWRWGLDSSGKRTKVPFIANMLGEKKASSTASSTWRAHIVATAVYEKSQSWEGTFTVKEKDGREVTYARKMDGIGFMCDGSFTFLDQDHCRNPETGEIDQDALARARAINSYTEPSVSGDGLHTYAEGTVPANRKHNGVEMYSTARFCVYTGRPLPDFPQMVERRQDEITALYKDVFPPRPELLWEMPPDDGAQEVDEDERKALLKDILQRASRAKDRELFFRLWNGDASDYPKKDGTPDHSRADAALCQKLRFYAGRAGYRVSTVDWLFRQSKLYRPKWERADYRNKTLAFAFGGSLPAQDSEEVAS